MGTKFFYSIFLILIGFYLVSGSEKCRKVNHHCKEFYHYEVHSDKKVSGHSRKVFDFFSTGHIGDEKTAKGFFCLVYHPYCAHEAHRTGLELRAKPCRSVCQSAWRFMKGTRKGRALWPKHLRCETLPEEDCHKFQDDFELKYQEISKHRRHEKPMGNAKNKETKERGVNHARLNAVQLLQDDDNVVEVINFGGDDEWRHREAKIFGANMDYFHGWADVQGKGSNNDYCRVRGKGHRKFLTCALDGEVSDVHDYVSTLGFEPGFRGTWYMKDEDYDGRDDYCRCVGNSHKSHISCMKAGKRGFYGGPLQGGNQYTFTIPDSGGCYIP